MNNVSKKRALYLLMSSALLVGAAGVAHANTIGNVTQHPQVIERQYQLPGGGFVRMETISWGNAPAQVHVVKLTPQQAQALWDRSMEQFRAVQTEMAEQMAQMQELMTTAFPQPLLGLPPVLSTAYQEPLLGNPFQVTISLPPVPETVLPYQIHAAPVPPSQPTTSPQGGASWPPHGTISVRYPVVNKVSPKLPI